MKSDVSISVWTLTVHYLGVYHHWRSTISGLGLATRRCFLPSTFPILAVTHSYITSLVRPHFPAPIMSKTTTAAKASSRFQDIFQAAVKSYQKQTKKDLIAHPLASQLQSCNSTTAIITVLQDRVREFDKSRSGDERLTKWLSPTVNVISAFSATVSGGVGLVSLEA